jgi:hypothetical protein
VIDLKLSWPALLVHRVPDLEFDPIGVGKGDGLCPELHTYGQLVLIGKGVV